MEKKSEQQIRILKERKREKSIGNYYKCKEEYDSALLGLLSYYDAAKAVAEKLNEDKDNISYIHARKNLLICCLKEAKRMKKAERNLPFYEDILNRSLYKEEVKEEETDDVRIESVEEVKTILNDTYNIVLKMKETK